MKRRSVRDVLDNPRKETEFYVLVMRYYPMELRKRALKFEESPFNVWDRELAPSPELLSDIKKGVIDWSEYTRRFLAEVPPSLIKLKAKTYQEQAGEKEVIFVCEEEEWEYPHCHTWILLDVISKNPKGDMLENPHIEVRFIVDIPESTGLNGTKQGPFFRGRLYALPKELADFYVKMGQAVLERKEAGKPTLRELFSGATLDSYIEATRTKPLLAEEMEKSAVEKWQLRVKAEGLVKEIREERAKRGV